MSVKSKDKVFVVVVISCILAMIVGIGWLIRYAFIRFNDEVDVENILFPNEAENYIEKIDLPEMPEKIVVSLMEDIETDAPAYEQAHYEYVWDLYYNDYNSKSIRECLKFLDKYPDSVLCDDIEYLLAINYRNMDEYEKALDHSAKVIVEYPNSSSISSAYYEIGYIYEWQLDKEEEALPYFIETLKYARIEDWLLISKATSSIESVSNIEIGLSYDYEILNTESFFADVLVESITPSTSRVEVEKIIKEIYQMEYLSNLALYRSDKNYSSYWYSDYAHSKNKNVSMEGFVANYYKGTMTIADYIK